MENEIAKFKKELKELLDKHNIEMSLSCFDLEAYLSLHINDKDGKRIETDIQLASIYETGRSWDEVIINDLL